jgi:Skp family chaperone for outer membrane proteins
MRHVITNSWSVLAVAGVLAIGSAIAQEPAATAVKPTNPGLCTQAQSQQVALPTCLEKLNLAPQQQAQIQEIVRDYDADVASVWKQFSGRYLETIRTEAILLSAIEDNLTEPQRQQVREQRRRVAQHEKAIAGTNVKAKQETVKPVRAVEQDLAIVGVSLTPEQEAAADAIQEKYLSRLRSLNRGIQGLHNRLVSLEADKLVEIEKVLTKDQLQQLCKIRQSAPPTMPAETASTMDAAQTR